MSTLKEKANKKRNSRQSAKVIETPSETIKPDLSTPANIDTQRVTDRRVIETAPAAVVGVNAPDLGKPEALAVKDYQKRGAIEKANSTPIVTPTQVAAQNPSGGITNANIEAAKTAIEEANKPLTLSDLLAEQRKKAEQEKTDAAKMQKYYALTDAFSALGKIGGAAIGGAVGGNAMDSSPAVAEYQPSRGYIDAFERAKQANDRLRAIDDKGFNLALREEDRSYRQQEAQLEREYRKQLAIFESELRAAQAQKDAELELEIKTKIENLNHEHKMAQEKLRGENETKNSLIYQDTVKYQNAGKNGGNGKSGARNSSGKVIPVIFMDKSVRHIPEGDLASIKNWLYGKTFGEGKKAVTVDEYNVDAIIRDNPELINELLVNLGALESPIVEDVAEEKAVETTEPIETSDAPQAQKTDMEAQLNQYLGISPEDVKVTPVSNISIMNETPNVARRADERNKKIAEKQAVKQGRIDELIEDGYTEREARGKIRRQDRIAKATAKYNTTSTAPSVNENAEEQDKESVKKSIASYKY